MGDRASTLGKPIKSYNPQSMAVEMRIAERFLLPRVEDLFTPNNDETIRTIEIRKKTLRISDVLHEVALVVRYLLLGMRNVGGKLPAASHDLFAWTFNLND